MKKMAFFITVCAVLLCLTGCITLRDNDSLPGAESQFSQFSVGESVRLVSKKGYERSLASDSVMSELSPASVGATPPADPYAGVSVSLVAAGDNLIHPNIYTDAYTRGNETKRYDFLPVYSDVADMISSADIAFINQETVMAGAEYGYSGWPCFNAPQALGDDLVSLGFDVVNIANNHMLDMGTRGLCDTISFWNTKPVTLIGGYADSADYDDLRITESGGIKIAWLSYTYGTNGITKNPNYDVIIPYIDDGLIISDLERAKEAADFVIVSIHWGDENYQEPNAEQRRLAKLIAENGGDLILGHHPHALQPIEWIKTDDKDVLCVYSLGNFISGMARPVNVVGGLLSLDIIGDNNGGLTVGNIMFTPTVFWYGMDWYGTHLYLMSDFTDSLASTHGVRIEGYTITPESARQIVTDVIDAEYLPEYLR